MASNMTSDNQNLTTSPEAEVFTDIISLQTRLQFEEVLFCGVLPFITLVGLVFNVMSFVTLLCQGTKETTNQVLIMLTVVDFLFLVAYMTPRMECIIRRFDAHLAYQLFTSRFWTPQYHLGRVSVMMVCVLGMERYIVVLHPLKVSTIITKRRVQIVCLVLSVLVFACASPMVMVYNVGHTFSPRFNATIIVPVPNAFIMKNRRIILDYMVGVTILLRYLPVAIIMFCTGAILRTLQKSRDWRKGSAGQADSTKDAEQRKITKTLLSVCILLIVCSFPGMVYNMIQLFAEDFSYEGRYKNLHGVLVSLVLLFEVVNSSVNFLLYITTSRKFMTTWRRVFCRCWKLQPKRADDGREKFSTSLATESASMSS